MIWCVFGGRVGCSRRHRSHLGGMWEGRHLLADRWGTLRRQLRGSPRGTKCGSSWELGNTVRTPQCKHCLGKDAAQAQSQIPE